MQGPQEPPPASTPTTVEPTVAAPAPAVEPAPSPSPQDDAEVLPEPVFTPFSLTVGDGFKFGCGFTMALVIAGLIGLLALSLVLLLASLVGAPIPVGR